MMTKVPIRIRSQVWHTTSTSFMTPPADGIARIVLNRPKAPNAQDTEFLYALNDAFDRAAQDDDIRVIILAANG